MKCKWTASGLLVAWLAVGGQAVFAFDWKLKEDPPKDKLASLENSKALSVKPPDSFFEPVVTFADRYGPYVAVGRNGRNEQRDVIDLRTGQKFGSLKGELRIGDQCALSPDGKWFAAAAQGTRGDGIFVVDVKANKVRKEIPTSKRVENLAFIDDARLVGLISWDGQLLVWDAVKGEEIKKLTLPGRGPRPMPAISPGGTYLAYPDDKRIRFLELESGEEVGELELPAAERNFHDRFQGGAFSPDGSSYAAAYEGFGKWRMVCWKLANGEVEGDYEVEESRNPFYKGPKIDWSPDSQGWLVNGELVVDRASGKVLWRVPENTYKGHVRLLAMNHLVGIVETGHRQRTLKSHVIGKDQVANMQKAVRTGGSAKDALLPKLVEADLGSAKTIDIPLGHVKWSAKPDGVEATNHLAARPFKTQVAANEVGNIRFSGPKAGRMVIEIKAGRGGLPNQPVEAKALEVYDLVTGKRVSRIDLPTPVRLLAVSPDGKSVVVGEPGEGSRVDVWNVEGGAHVCGWRPFAKEPAKQNAVTFAAVVGENQILTANGHGKVAIWSVPDGKALFAAEANDVTTFKTSPGGRLIFGIGKDQVRCFDAASLTPLGDLNLPSAVSGASMEIKAVALRPDGKEAAALVHGTGPGGFQQAIARWDLANGLPSESIRFAQPAVPIGFPNQVVALEYAGDRHLLVENQSLVDLRRKDVVWTYVLNTFLGRHAADRPDGRHWYVTANTPTEQVAVVAVSLPEKDVERYVQQITDGGSALLKPGSQLAVQLNFSGQHAESARATTMEQLKQAFKARNLTIAPRGDATLTLTATERATGESIEFRKMFPDLGESPFATTSVALFTIDCQATLQVGGQVVWRSGNQQLSMQSFGILHLPAGEKDVGRFLRNNMWNNVAGWATRVGPPRYLVRTSQGVMALPGTTNFTATGPNTIAPIVRTSP